MGVTMKSPTKRTACVLVLLLVAMLMRTQYPVRLARGEGMESPLNAMDGAIELEQGTEPTPEPDPEQEPVIELGEKSANDPSSSIVLGEDAPAQDSASVQVQSDTSGSITSGVLTVSYLNASNELAIPYPYCQERTVSPEVMVSDDYLDGTVSVVSSDPSVAKVDSAHESWATYGYSYESLSIQPVKVGTATITVTYTRTEAGTSDVVTFKVVCYPDCADGVTAKKASNTTVGLSWKAFAGATGYHIYLEYYDYDASAYFHKLVKTITDASTTSASVTAPWDQYCEYIVLPYYKASGTVYENKLDDFMHYGYYDYPEGTYAEFQLPYPAASKPTAKRAAYNKVALSWKQCNGATGYKVYRAKADDWGYATEDYKTVATVKGADTTSVKVEAAWDVQYAYAVRPYLTYGGKTYVQVPSSYSYDTSTLALYALPRPTVSITSVAKASSNKLKVTWKAYKGATSYKLYRSSTENSGYALVTTLAADTTSHSVKATPGIVYYFKVLATYGKVGKVTSGTFAQQIPVTSGAAATAKSVAVPGLGAWYDTYGTYTYAQGKRTYVTSRKERTLTIIGYDQNLKKVYAKKVRLDAFDFWGGVYHGPDDNNYVVTGFGNYKESKKKTVIKITQYSKAWKKGKTATIKGDASNSFDGIYEPFRASSIALDMQGTTLYMMTGRTMFETSDGLHHQSNIGFRINTKTMKATVSNISYASHSFGQRVRFKDGTLYVADHGDAYPRAMQLTWQVGYGTKSAQTVEALDAFKIMGETGDNYTGASLDGMEISNSTAILCGASVPQSYGVQGVKGTDYKLQRNLYVTITNRATGSTKVRWLTTYHPKKKTGVAAVRMTKLSDNRFGILYSVTTGNKSAVHYMVIDANGNKVFSRTIKGASLSGATQPCYANGKLVWLASASDYKGRLYSIRAF